MRYFTFLWLMMVAFAMVACNNGNSKEEKMPDSVTLAAPVQPALIYNSMDSVLSDYYQLKETFVDADTVMVVNYSNDLDSAVDHFPSTKMKLDTIHSQVLHGIIESMKGEIKGLQMEADMDGKRQEFRMISDILYDMVRLVGLKSQKIYRLYCPDAFDRQGAYWLSDHPGGDNPYGKEASEDCGQVRETIQF